MNTSHDRARRAARTAALGLVAWMPMAAGCGATGSETIEEVATLRPEVRYYLIADT